MPQKKKPTIKEMEKVVSNIIHDLQIVNQKSDAAFWGLKNFVKFSKKEKAFDKWLLELKEKAEKERDERDKSIKASIKADSKQSDKGK